MRTGDGVRQRRAHEQIDRRVVGNFSVHDHAAMSMRRVLAQAHVGDDHHVRHRAAYRAHGFRDRAARIVRTRTSFVLVWRDPEEQHRLHAIGPRGLTRLDDDVHRHLRDAGHGSNGLAYARAADRKERKDQLLRGKPRFLHERPEGRGAAKAAQPAGKGQGGRCGRSHILI
jgi:hypothetical protein